MYSFVFSVVKYKASQKFKNMFTSTTIATIAMSLKLKQRIMQAVRTFTTQKMTHVDEKGKAQMVDVGEKEISRRTATAVGIVQVGPTVSRMIKENEIKKGDALSVAKLAGIMAAKKTSDLIPLCHNLLLNDVHVKTTLQEDSVLIEATVKCDGKTGVEMEALTAVSVAALTIYDMCKAVTHDMCIKDVRLIKKTGGSKGDFHR